jgi:DNA-binding NarL/FixJ family response regulator
MRVVIAEDHALLREGLVALLRGAGIEVLATTDTGPGLLDIVTEHDPELAIIDVRLPPGFADEGIRAAIAARSAHPGLATVILSQYVEPVYTAELLDSPGGGIGYLLKERVSDVAEFVDALTRVAAGGTALDREVVTELVRTRSATSKRLDALTPRERETLALMAEGRTNAGVAKGMVVTLGAVEKHISNIFAKLDLPDTDDDHRRVLAVLTYLRTSG